MLTLNSELKCKFRDPELVRVDKKNIKEVVRKLFNAVITKCIAAVTGKWPLKAFKSGRLYRCRSQYNHIFTAIKFGNTKRT